MRVAPFVKEVNLEHIQFKGVRPRNAAIKFNYSSHDIYYRTGELSSHSELMRVTVSRNFREELSGHYKCWSVANSIEDVRISPLSRGSLCIRSGHLPDTRGIGFKVQHLPHRNLQKKQDVEKNIIPIDWTSNSLTWVWSLGPQLRLICTDMTGKIIREKVTKGVSGWNYGVPRGGTNYIDVGPYKITIAHSSYMTKIGRKYVGFPVVQTIEYPFSVVSVGAPIMASKTFAGGYGGGKKKAVVFPCGLIRDGNQCLCSLGYNDSQVRIVTFNALDLLAWCREPVEKQAYSNLRLVDVEYWDRAD